MSESKFSFAFFEPLPLTFFINVSIFSFNSSLPENRISVDGIIENSSTLSVLLWLSISKWDILSTVSPQKSIRTGASPSGENRSSIPPRTENCPTPSTISLRVYPEAESTSRTLSSEVSLPTFKVKECFFKSSQGIVLCIAASTEQTATSIFPSSIFERTFKRLCSYSCERYCAPLNEKSRSG